MNNPEIVLPEGSGNCSKSFDGEDSGDCYHHWVTQTLFRFDVTYCCKCGVTKDELDYE